MTDKIKLALIAFVVLSMVMPLILLIGVNLILESGGYNQIAYSFWSWLGVWLIMLAAKSEVSFK